MSWADDKYTQLWNDAQEYLQNQGTGYGEVDLQQLSHHLERYIGYLEGLIFEANECMPTRQQKDRIRTKCERGIQTLRRKLEKVRMRLERLTEKRLAATARSRNRSFR